jgi:hypothetical protein
MNYYKALLRQAYPVDIESSETSYFSPSAAGLDPRLFQGKKLTPSVRNSVMSLALNALNNKFHGAENWAEVWLAGSGVSYHWYAHRDPADLDCLVGIDYPVFRQMNPNYTGFSNQDIASEVNDVFNTVLHPETEDYLGSFDLTFYANVKSDIRDIKPYAAYSLTHDNWTVEPREDNVQRRPEWDQVVQQDIQKAYEITDRYKRHLQELKVAPHDAARRNAEVMLSHTIQQGAALFDEIHENRSHAFSPTGEGYEDFTNYRWQAGKESGIIQALKMLKSTSKNLKSIEYSEKYGVDLPDASVLLRRAASKYLNQGE